jgi:NAD(P)-dependent dehydrogenase (short-subunit alcohol dehydrogenase family)
MDARVAIVTGGTFGIGAGISVGLARRGWRVVAFGMDAPRMLQAELRAQDLDADVLEADVSKAADVQGVVDHAMGRYARIDALVNNAAIGPLGSVLQTNESGIA